MQTRITISGPVAEVRWGYHLAAELREWSVAYGVITATAINVDPFRIRQSALTLVIPNPAPAAPIRRRLDGVQITGDAFAARLGPKE